MMEMKYPSLDQFVKNNFDFDGNINMDQSFELIASCVNKIYNEDEVWSAADVTKKELIAFLEQMNTIQFKEIVTRLSFTLRTLNLTNLNTSVLFLSSPKVKKQFAYKM